MNPEELQDEIEELRDTVETFSTENESQKSKIEELSSKVLELEASKIGGTTSSLVVRSIENMIFKKILIGSVSSNGQIFLDFPSGWTSARTATGKYTITHTLGTSNFVITFGCTTTTGNPRILNVITVTDSAITLETSDDAGTLADAAYFFIIVAP